MAFAKKRLDIPGRRDHRRIAEKIGQFRSGIGGRDDRIAGGQHAAKLGRQDEIGRALVLRQGMKIRHVEKFVEPGIGLERQEADSRQMPVGRL